MNIIEVSPSVYMHQDDSYYLVNNCCVVLDSKLVFVDTGLSDEKAEAFLKEMQNLYPEKEIMLVLTHAHGDHISGIKPFVKVPILVSRKFGQSLHNNMKRYGWEEKKKEYYGSLNFVELSDKKILGENDNNMVFRQAGGHSPESIYGYYPRDKVLLTGDNLLSKMPQFFPFDNTDLDDWIATLKEWEKMDIDIVVVGHGDITTKDHITKVRGFFEELLYFLNQSLEDNLSISEVLAHDDCPSYFEDDPEGWTINGIRAYYKIMENK